MITLVHGPAELLRSEALAGIAAGIAADPEIADLNTARLDGRQASLGELQNACDTLPFLAERRLVVVEGLLVRLAGSPPGSSRGKGKAVDGLEHGAGDEPSEEAPPLAKGQAKAFLAYLDSVPDTAELVLLEEDLASGPAFRRLQELASAGRAKIVLCEKPKRNDLPDWIRSRARLWKVRLDPAAIADLAEFVGDELRQIDQELLKLADYAPGRVITRQDIRALVPATRAASVFEMVDALGLGDGAAAGRLLKRLLDVDGEAPLRLIGMIARQYRLLIHVKAMQAQGARPPEIARAVGVGEWVVPRLATQASRHSFGHLELAMERVLAADEAIKTGKLSDREAMDVLLAELLES